MSVDCAVLAQDLKSYFKGDIQSIKPNPRGWGSSVVLPQWIRLTVTGVTWEQAYPYERHWATEYDWSIIVHNAVLDGYRIEVFTTEPSVSGDNVATRAQIENYLEGYNMQFVSAAHNAIRFDFGVYQTAISSEFMDEIPLAEHSQIVFEELSYDQPTGVHQISADYSALGITSEKALKFVSLYATEVISSSGGVLVYEINRQTVNSRIKSHFKDKLDSVFKRRKFRIPLAIIDAWVSQGGIIEVTKNELLLMIEDKTSL